MINPMLWSARAEFYARAWPSPTSIEYARRHELDVDTIARFAGAFGIAEVIDCNNRRFDFRESDNSFAAAIIEAFGSDGETCVDLVGWPLDRPDYVMTVAGRCGLLGAWEAMNPATYIMGARLRMHRTPLGWLKAGCEGAVVVVAQIAARMLLELPGKVAGEDPRHARALQRLARSVVPDDLATTIGGRAA